MDMPDVLQRWQQVPTKHLFPALAKSHPPVLFSVLVLHWITAKDNASTLSGTSLADLRAPTSPIPIPKPLVGRPPLSDLPSSYELRAYKKPTTTTRLTTTVSAPKQDIWNDDLDRIHSLPPNAITVEHNLVRQVSGRRSEKSLSEGQGQELTCSEEDLFRKC